MYVSGTQHKCSVSRLAFLYLTYQQVSYTIIESRGRKSQLHHKHNDSYKYPIFKLLERSCNLLSYRTTTQLLDIKISRNFQYSTGLISYRINFFLCMTQYPNLPGQEHVILHHALLRFSWFCIWTPHLITFYHEQ